MMLLPEMKVEPSLRDLAVLLKTNDTKVKINTLLAPFIELENRELFFLFISDLKKLGSSLQIRYETNDDDEGEEEVGKESGTFSPSLPKMLPSLNRKTMLTLQFDVESEKKLFSGNPLLLKDCKVLLINDMCTQLYRSAVTKDG